MGKGKGHTPIRTCISCGAKRKKHELTRISIDTEGQLIKDVSGKMQGRGAYICKTPSCHHQLSKHRSLNRVFRTNKNIKVEFIRKQ